jgi:hypothetical protein
MPTRGLNDEEIFRCIRHGHWIPSPLVDRWGSILPAFRWRLYDWRL